MFPIRRTSGYARRMVGINQTKPALLQTTVPASIAPTTTKLPATTVPDALPADARAPKLNALNPYSFTADGYAAPTEARIARYDRAGPAPDPRADTAKPAGKALSPLATRIAAMTAKPQTFDVAGILGAMRTHRANDAVAQGLPGVAALFDANNDPADRKTHLAAVHAFTVTSASGKGAMALDDKIMGSPALTPEAKARVLGALVTAHRSLTTRGGDASFNDVNWKHLAAEVGQVLDVAKMSGLHRSAAGKDKAEDAVVASIFSDLVKYRETLLDHNVHGAIAAATQLKGIYPEARLAGIVQATLEHQIGPPRFMAMITKMKIEGALKAGGLDDAQMKQAAAVIERVRDKIADPMNPAHVEMTPAGYAQVAFSDQQIDLGGGKSLSERDAMSSIGLDAWYTPHPDTPWFEASMAVINGDSLVNYVTPEGVGKIVAISGPDTFFKDPTVFDSMFSSGASYVDAVSVMSDAAMAPVRDGVDRTKSSIDAVRTSLDDQMHTTGALSFPTASFDALAAAEKVDTAQLTVRRDGDRVSVFVPVQQDGSIAFWNAPLDYDAKGAPYEFAKLIRRETADQLRSM